MAEPISKAKISLISSLAKGKFRRQHGLFVAEGHKCVEDTISVFRPAYIVALRDRLTAPMLQNLSETIIYEATPQQMSKLSSLSTAPDIVAVYEIPNSEIESTPKRGELYLALDGVQDPGNLGTIVRTAHWFGVKIIYCSLDTVDIYNPKTVMATMGSLGHVAVTYCDLAELINSMDKNIPVYGTLLEGKNIYQEALTPGGLIVMGNEGKGISERVKALIKAPLTIPSFNDSDHPESLNVGVATAVTLSQFRSRIQ